MPDDLLRFVGGPAPYSSGWLWVALFLLALLIGWYVTVILLTLPRRQAQGLLLVGAARGELTRRRFARAVRAIGRAYRAGDLAAAPAGAALNREVRAFLRATTGVHAEYLQVEDLAGTALAPAAGVLADLVDVQFNDRSTVDAGAASDAAEELIRAWT